MKKDRQHPGTPAAQVLANCGKCGLCLSACPVYRILKEEQASPRARLQLIKAHDRDDLQSSPLLKELISKCLMCGSCARACPSGINHYEKFMEMRQKMVADLGEEPAIKALIHLLSKEFMLRAGTRMAALGQRITPDALAEKYRVGNIPLSRLPKLNRTRFRKAVPYVTPPAPGLPLRGRIAYFTGCATNFMFDDTGRATVAVLSGLGYEVIIPDTQVCCAIPMLFHGAAEQAVSNIRTNIKALTEFSCDRIIVDCTTCGAALRDEYPAFLARAAENPDLDKNSRLGDVSALARQADAISQKTADILSFLMEPGTGFDKVLSPDPGRESVRTVYHAPCHSRNSFNSHDRVKDMLRRLPGIDYIPLPSEADCCGGGGTFFYEHPELARQMMDKKRAMVQAAMASLWLTDCPVCRINISGSLTPGDAVEVLHPVTMAARAMGAGSPETTGTGKDGQ